jgi:hypothetical protein
MDMPKKYPMKPVIACAALVLASLFPPGASSQVAVSISIAPPPLLVYAQPVVPGDGYIWAPGYWSWSEPERDYHWVPGTWVLAPTAGDLWTPGYWAFEGAGYFWHGGYWGSSVGYYGGVNYGYGYAGAGYQGGRWDHGAFQYNRAVSHIDSTRERNFYSAQVVNHAPATRVSYNGGPGGTRAQPTAAEREVPAGGHAGPTAEQVQHEHQAVATAAQRLSVSHGAPPVAATPRPSAFTGPGIERTRPAAPPRPATVTRAPTAPRQEAEPRAQAPAPQARPERAAPQTQQQQQQQQRPERSEPQERGGQRPEEPGR